MATHPRHPDDLVPLDDAHLVRLAQELAAGTDAERATAERCIAVVVVRRRPLIRTVVAAKVPRSAVDEVEAAVLLRFAVKVYSGDPIQNPAGLLVQMAKFARADHLSGQADGVPIESWDGGADDPDLEAAGIEAAVEELLAPLTERQREIVWHRVVQGRPSAEVAAMLDTTHGNVDVIVHRALAKMREAAR